jgi:hypothetical protein
MSDGTILVTDKETAAVKVAKDLVRKLKLIALSRGVPMSDLVSEWLRPTVEREYPKALKKMADDEQRPADCRE